MTETSPIKDPNEKQVGGDHYDSANKIQHWDMVEENCMGYLEGCATKYVVRWRNKNGEQDVEKSRHYVEKIMSLHLKGDKRLKQKEERLQKISENKDTEYDWVKWCLENNVSFPENQICIRLSTWSTTEDLLHVLGLIDRLLGAISIEIDPNDIARHNDVKEI